MCLQLEIKEVTAAMPTERLEAELCQLAAHISAATCRWLLMVAEYDRRGAWASWECRSCAHWLSYMTGLGIHAARQHVRVASKLEELPAITDAFSRGELSFSKVRALVRIALPETEADLVGLGRAATASQLERIARAMPPEPLEGGDSDEDERRRQSRRFLRWSWDDEGELTICGRLHSDEGAVVIQAIEAAMAQVRRERTEHRKTAADGLLRVCEQALAAGEIDSSGGDRNLVILHTTPEALADGKGSSHLDLGPGVLGETASRLACDSATVTALTDGDGVPLDIGRKTQKVPVNLRRALHLRDHRCRFPGCTNKFSLDAHHIRHWGKGGETSLANLVLLCRHHHRAVHEGPWNAEADTDGVVFSRGGWSGRHSRIPTSGDHRQVERINADAGLEIDGETLNADLSGERLNFAYAADVLIYDRQAAIRRRGEGGDM